MDMYYPSPPVQSPRFARSWTSAVNRHICCRERRTPLSALGVDDKIAERVINHKPVRIKRVYDRHEYFNEKKDALTKWEEHLSNTLARLSALPAACEPNFIRRPSTCMLSIADDRPRYPALRPNTCRICRDAAPCASPVKALAKTFRADYYRF